MTDIDAWDRDSFHSRVLFFAVLAATEAFILLGQQNTATLTSAAVLMLALPIYLLLGRPVLERQADASPPTSYLHAMAVVYLFAAALDVTALIMLAVLGTQTFKLLPLRRAAVEFLLLTLVPLACWTVLVDDNKELLFRAVLTGLIAAVGITCAVWIQRIIDQSSERADLIAALEESNDEIERLSVAHGVLLERGRLAREIHDTLAQGFTSVVTLSRAVDAELATDPVKARRHVELITRTATDNLAECRAVIAASSPPLLSGGTLRSALIGLTQRLHDDTGIVVDVSVDGHEQELPEPVAAVGLRATQEALNNVSKHARATSVAVGLRYEDGACTITITDDGLGFDPTTTSRGVDASGSRTGFGLQGMRSRVAEIGGMITISTGEGSRGTSVALWLPTTHDIVSVAGSRAGAVTGA